MATLNACSTDGVVISTRGLREDRIGTIEAHAGGRSTKTSRGEGHTITSPSTVTKSPRLIEAAKTRTIGRSVIVSSIGDTVAKAKEPRTPVPPARLTGDPTQKPGLAGSVETIR